MNPKARVNNRSINGFTIVELVTIIVVIGILATIGTVSLFSFQAKSRDSQRSSSANVIAEALEKYYDKNGEYPLCDDASNKIPDAALGNIDKTVLTAPGANNGTNSLVCNGDPESSQFTYSRASDGTWSLKYKNESDNKIISITNRRSVVANAIDTKVKLIGEADIYIEVGSNYQDEGAVLVNHSSGAQINGVYPYNLDNSVNTNIVGDYLVAYGYYGSDYYRSNGYGEEYYGSDDSITYKPTDNIVRNVYVRDYTSPDWNIFNNSDVYIEYGSSFDVDSYINDPVYFDVCDNYDGCGLRVYSSGYYDTYSPGDYWIDMIAYDSSGNYTYGSFLLHVNSYYSPDPYDPGYDPDPDYPYDDPGYDPGYTEPEPYCQWCEDNGYTPENGYDPTYDPDTGSWDMGEPW